VKSSSSEKSVSPYCPNDCKSKTKFNAIGPIKVNCSREKQRHSILFIILFNFSGRYLAANSNSVHRHPLPLPRGIISFQRNFRFRKSFLFCWCVHAINCPILPSSLHPKVSNNLSNILNYSFSKESRGD
jgi:hypothetical protein